MNEEELALAKAAAEGTAAGLTKSLHEVVLNLAGPASKEFGLELGEMFKDWRQKRALERGQRALRILKERRAPRRLIPIPVFVPLLEAASLETNSELQERWSQLLASAADANRGEITRAYGEILAELTPQDARLLDWVLDHEPEVDQNVPEMSEEVAAQPIQLARPPRATFDSLVKEFSLSPEEFLLTCSRLERVGVCDVGRFVFPTRLGNSGTGPRRYDSIALRPLGVAFIRACRGY
jgi:hypothetical protein